MSTDLTRWLSGTLPGSWQDTLALAFVTLLMGLALYRFSPDSRRRLRMSLVLTILLFGLLRLSLWLGSDSRAMSWVLLAEVSVVLLGLIVLRVWGMVVCRLVLPVASLTPPRILEDILVAVAYLAWGLVLLRQAGLDLSQIVTTSAVITAVLAFAMQDTLGNILAGIALQLDNSVDIGDWVKVDDVTGRVVEINWRATSVETRNWETVVIPNSVLMKQKFVILGKRQGAPEQWRRWVTFDVDWDTLPTQVIQQVERALNEAHIPHVAGEPAPNCVLMGFETGFCRYAVRYWLTDLNLDDPTDSLVRAHVDAALRRHNVRIAAPQFNVAITKENEKYFEARHRRHIEERLAALARVDLFAPLTEAERVQLAEQLRFTPFVSGDTIMQQGQVAHRLYILIKGEVEVWIDEGQGRQLVDVLGPGQVFGEMGLMTGEARSATVVARGTVECFRLDKDALQTILSSRKELLESLSRTLEKRLAERRKRHGVRPVVVPTPEPSNELVDKMRRFFGMTRGGQ
ncbi:mechanosensitive ion channel family protein [Crenobacter cavernae]|uniref:Small-conductance mechanosensitive channel n=1 Tax=Crenobacter cavernae TaxID=2290923 RepID=A0ABY0FHX9_9NEIS|nr:mechanosensitive ion channel family protein [Crenobacter cavernae]RXZ44982.1 mechanosensitive ion channel protein MscS [Crenobacter cavernae]